MKILRNGKPVDFDREALRTVVTEACKTWQRKYEHLARDEKRDYQLQQIANFAAEINSAYCEQRSGLANYRLLGEDVLAILSLSEWMLFDERLERWRRDPENDMAWQMRQADVKSEQVEARMKTAPVEPKRPRLSPPMWCSKLDVDGPPLRWEKLVSEFLRAQRQPPGGARESER